MTIAQKQRSLFCGYCSPAWTKVGDARMISLDDWPLELEGVLLQWLVSMPRDEVLNDNLADDEIIVKRLSGAYVTEDGYDFFMRWLVDELRHSADQVTVHRSHL